MIKKQVQSKKSCATVVRLSDRPSDRSVDILMETDQNGVAGHYYLVTDTKQLLKKLVCEHCGSIQTRLNQYKTHIAKCVEGRVRHVYTGGFHKEPLVIKDKLESVESHYLSTWCIMISFSVMTLRLCLSTSVSKQTKLNTLASTVQCPMPSVTARGRH